MDYQEYLKSKTKPKTNTYLKNLISRILISIIFILCSLIYINQNDQNKSYYQETLFTNSLAFNKFNEVYQKYMGDLDVTTPTEIPVFNESINYRSIEKYLDGSILEVGTNTLVSSINSGIVVFNGEKEEYGQTLIIQGVDGTDIWYSGLEIHGISLYDYIESGSLLGQTLNEDLTIVIMKNGEALDFEEYTAKI